MVQKRRKPPVKGAKAARAKTAAKHSAGRRTSGTKRAGQKRAGQKLKKTKGRAARPKLATFKELLRSEPPRRAFVRGSFPHSDAKAARDASFAAADVEAAPMLAPAADDALAADAMGADALAADVPTGPVTARTFVALVSHTGPWELRSLVVNDFQILETTELATDRRIDVEIPSAFGDQLRINWSILAGHLIPGLAAFIQLPGQDPVLLAEKAPLKKGESWAPLAPSQFP